MHSIPGFDLVYDNPWRLLEFDKLAHMALFAGFVLTQIIAFRKQIAFRKLRNHAKKYAVVISLIYGGLLEFYQGQIFTMRTSDPIDFLANAIGVFLGLVLFRLVYGSELSRI